MVKVARDGTDGRVPNLHFSTDISKAIDEAQLIFIAVNTPTKTVGLGAGSASDLAYVESAARHIAEVATTDKIIVEKSTVPCGTADTLRDLFETLSPNVRFDILSNPEFLAEGTAISDLLDPDRVLIGSVPHCRRSKAASDALADVYAAWIPRRRIITTNLWSSELSKLAANCMLAQRISSVNSLSAVCEATGADIDEISRVVGKDNRIGSRMLKASAGFGGSCFKKDVLSLVYIAETLHLPEVAQYWRAVVDVNEYQKDRLTKRITRCLNNTLAHKKVGILGFAYKKNTGDTRESAAISVVAQLVAEKAQVAIYDPQVQEDAIYRELEYAGCAPSTLRSNVKVHRDAVSVAENANAIVILTEWDHFKTDALPVVPMLPRKKVDLTHGVTSLRIADDSQDDSCESSDSGIDIPESDETKLSQADGLTDSQLAELQPKRVDWQQMATVMRRPRLVFDGRNIVEPERLADLGFRVECIGKVGARAR